MNIVISGSRWYTTPAPPPRIEEYVNLLCEENFENLTIVHGCCRGIDEAAARWAKSRGIHIFGVPYPSDLGKRGGPIRNSRMLSGAHAVLAYPKHDGRGTQDVIKKALSMRIPMIIHWLF